MFNSNDEAYKAWLEALQPGDQVALFSPVSGGDRIQIMAVRRRTPRWIFVGYPHKEEELYRMRVKDGTRVESSKDAFFSGETRIRPITPEVTQRLRMRRIEAQARDLGSRLSRNVIIPPQHGAGDREALIVALDALKAAMDAVDQIWADRRGDKA
jgi:hypothetical protein